ncbi:MAG: DUF3791 domain-containing protein [Clostridia bacterium]|nr:DUF3791 domain-containing protein [Clostridia bacterium]
MTPIKLAPGSRFFIFALEQYKYAKGMTGKDTLDLFERYSVMSYIQEFYDVLHTFGTGYIISDLDDYMKHCDEYGVPYENASAQ